MSQWCWCQSAGAACCFSHSMSFKMKQRTICAHAVCCRTCHVLQSLLHMAHACPCCVHACLYYIAWSLPRTRWDLQQSILPVWVQVACCVNTSMPTQLVLFLIRLHCLKWLKQIASKCTSWELVEHTMSFADMASGKLSNQMMPLLR